MKNRKLFIASVFFIFIAGSVFMYSMCSFYWVTTDFTKWEDDGRFAYCLLQSSFVAMMIPITMSLYELFKND